MKFWKASWWFQMLLALDRFLNVFICDGDSLETMSGYAWRMEQHGKPWGKITRPTIDWLFSPWMSDHCQKQHLLEVQRGLVEGL